jgi:PAS domain S-box-containing protein
VLQDLRAESYVGVTLFGHDGQPVGLIAGIGRIPLTNRPLAEATMKLVAVRAAGEMERLEAEESLRSSEENYRTLFSEMLDGFALHEIICNADGEPADYRFLAINPAFERLTGLKKEDLIGRTVLEVMPDTERQWIDIYGKVALTGEPAFFNNYSAGLNKHFEVTAFRPAPNQFACIFSDITERKQAELEKNRLETQLQQAQKMESVGRLAGGVAHDFNNMLTVILGHAELALMKIDPTQPLFADMEQIHKSAERSASLTRQLLAFARKQVISPVDLDLNESVAGVLKMLQRLIGECIHLTWRPAANLWNVKMDPSQIDQILANLCVNARDSIVDVGDIIIETGNCSLDKEYCAQNLGFVPGDYLRLSVSDNGSGMDKETIEHIFEPFFTTKRMGEGTGLGLATVYGIVKQNNGFINVYSEPGCGTTFTIYLPRHEPNDGHVRSAGDSRQVSRGHETILLVEDEPAILKLTTEILGIQGYTVMPTSVPAEAIRIASEHVGEIHMIMTDVVMPEMNGRDLAKKLQSLYPQLKCLFMSGYTADVIAHYGVLDEDVHFIQKPFSMRDLSIKVREILDCGKG